MRIDKGIDTCPATLTVVDIFTRNQPVVLHIDKTPSSTEGNHTTLGITVKTLDAEVNAVTVFQRFFPWAYHKTVLRQQFGKIVGKYALNVLVKCTYPAFCFIHFQLTCRETCDNLRLVKVLRQVNFGNTDNCFLDMLGSLHIIDTCRMQLIKV